MNKSLGEFKDGFYSSQEITDEMYFDDVERLNASTIKVILNKGVEAIRYGSKTSKAMEFGHAFHMVLLEEDKFHNTYGIAMEKGTTKSGKAERANIISSGLKVITESDCQLIKDMKDSLMLHDEAREIYMGESVNEGVVLFTIYGVQCKAKIDHFSEKGITDIKTAADPSFDEFNRDIFKYGYDISMRFYQKAMFSVLHEELLLRIIAIGKEKPQIVEVYDFDDHDFKTVDSVIKRACELWRLKANGSYVKDTRKTHQPEVQPWITTKRERFINTY